MRLLSRSKKKYYNSNSVQYTTHAHVDTPHNSMLYKKTITTNTAYSPLPYSSNYAIYYTLIESVSHTCIYKHRFKTASTLNTETVKRIDGNSYVSNARSAFEQWQPDRAGKRERERHTHTYLRGLPKTHSFPS